MKIQSGGPFSHELLDQDVVAVKSRYKQEGFLFMELDSLAATPNGTARAIDIFMHIEEGKPAVLRSVFFEGNTAIESAALLSELASKPGYRFRQDAVERDVQAVLQHYERRGYPFAKVSVKDVSFHNEETAYDVDLMLSVNEGDVVTVSELTVWGNSATKYDVIAREARLHRGETFHPELAARIQQRLQRLQLFSSVSLPELYVQENGTAGFIVRVVEGNPNYFDGIVGYVPSNRPGESGYFTGLASVQLRNLFGTGRKLSARWHRENQSTQEIELRYHEPWIASYPVNGEVGFFQRKQDSAYVRRSYDLSAEFMLTEEFRVGASLSQLDVVPSEGLTVLTVSESYTTTVGGFLFYDSRDDAIIPRTGLMYRIEYQTGVKKRALANATLSTSTQRFGLDLEHYLPTFERQVLSTSVYFREFRSGGTEVSDLFRLGGATTVRGYREGQFLGSRVAWSNLEYRFLVGPRSFLYTFADAAYISTPELIAAGLRASEQTKIGYGVGLRLDTAVGLIGVSLALGQGDTFSTAKLHLRLVNEF